MSKQILDRYHRDVYFPKWSEESFSTFLKEISKKRCLVFSPHSIEKLLGDSFKYGQIYAKFVIKAVKIRNFSFDKVFEFYAIEEEIKKVCLRFSYAAISIDIVLVVSLDGTVITIYTIDKDDTHDGLNKNLYKKGK